MCQCINSQLECYSKSCKDLKYPSFSLLKLKLNQTKQINARTIPFFADIIKSMKKKSKTHLPPTRYLLKLSRMIHNFIFIFHES